MVRYMADAVSCGAFPTGPIPVPGRGVQPVALRAGYVNGRWPTALTCGTEVSIDVNGSAPGADVLDIETGDATPDSAPGWVRSHHAQSNDRAVLYCNRSVRPAVAAACEAAGLQPGRDFWWWIATLDGTETVSDMTGVVAVQVWSANYFSTDIDLSIVYDDAWKGNGPAPQEDDMGLIQQTDRGIWLVGPGYAAPIAGPEVGPMVARFGNPTVYGSAADFDAVTTACRRGLPDVWYTAFDDAGNSYVPNAPWASTRLAGVDGKTGQINAKADQILTKLDAVAPAAPPVAVDPAALAAALAPLLLADPQNVDKLGASIASHLQLTSRPTGA